MSPICKFFFHPGAASVSQKSTVASRARCRLGRQVIPVALRHYNNYNFDNNCNFNEAGHEKLCSEAVDERKVRSGGKERKQAARDQVKENVGRYEEAAKDYQAGKEAIKEVKKMFKKKASEESGRKAKAKAKNDN